MLYSLALVFISAIMLGGIFKKFKLPPLLGMIVAGIILGPYALGLLDSSLIGISPDLRKIALIIILTRAGLGINLTELKKVGRPAVLMCFVPACFEIVAMVVLAPMLLGVTFIEAAIMGTVVAAVSPAVIVPRMLRLANSGYGAKNAIPQMLMAGASVDDVFVIVLFTSFAALGDGVKVALIDFARIPVSIVLGVLGGVLCGVLLGILFKKLHMRDSIKVIIILSVSFLLVTIEQSLTGVVAFSGLIAVMVIGIILQKNNKMQASRISDKYAKLWVFAEMLLFVLVGACVDTKVAISYGFAAVAVILFCLVFRMLGVWVCLIATKLTQKEKLFCMLAYCPKATVQAAIGAIPLAMGLACGNIVLAVAVLSILITAPLGAIAIDVLYKKLLPQNICAESIDKTN